MLLTVVAVLALRAVRNGGGGAGDGGAAASAHPTGPVAGAPGAARPVRDLLVRPADLGPEWAADPRSAALDLRDGPGLVHPCGTSRPSDRLRVDRAEVAVVQRIPLGGHAVFEVARYAGDGAAAAGAEVSAAVRSCPAYRATYQGRPEVAVTVSEVPGGGVGALLSVAEDGGRYVFLVRPQGDLLVSAMFWADADAGDLADFGRRQVDVAVRSATS